MVDLDWCFYGDEVEILEDYKDYGGKTIARKGEIAIVGETQMSLNEHISIDIKGKKVTRYLPTWILKIVKRNEKSRQEYLEREKIKQEKHATFNIQVGDIINLKGFSYSKTPLYKAKVTRVIDYGVYAYKIKSNGERYTGKFGNEELHFYGDILTEEEVNKIIKKNKAKAKEKDLQSQFKIGLYIPHTFWGWGMIEWVGQITDISPRNVFIDYGANPFNWHTKEEKKWFRNSIETKEKVQETINKWGVMDYSIERLKELGFIVSEDTKVFEIVDKYPKLKIS